MSVYFHTQTWYNLAGPAFKLEPLLNAFKMTSVPAHYASFFENRLEADEIFIFNYLDAILCHMTLDYCTNSQTPLHSYKLYHSNRAMLLQTAPLRSTLPSLWTSAFLSGANIHLTS